MCDSPEIINIMLKSMILKYGSNVSNGNIDLAINNLSMDIDMISERLCGGDWTPMTAHNFEELGYLALEGMDDITRGISAVYLHSTDEENMDDFLVKTTSGVFDKYGECTWVHAAFLDLIMLYIKQVGIQHTTNWDAGDSIRATYHAIAACWTMAMAHASVYAVFSRVDPESIIAIHKSFIEADAAIVLPDVGDDHPVLEMVNAGLQDALSVIEISNKYYD